jgi:tetratricopeptide (TPR) repeat protein
LTGCTASPHKDNPEITYRKIAILNNLSCLYENERDFHKALKYNKLALDLATSNLDKAVMYNNNAKIYLQLGQMDHASLSIKLAYESFKDEADNVK